jgi:hypothetical protein
MKPISNIKYQPGKLYFDNILVKYIPVEGIINNIKATINRANTPRYQYLFLNGKNNNIRGNNAR